VGLDLALMSPVPPSAKRVPTERAHHGDVFVDEYAWLTDPKAAETIAYLEAENSYTESQTGGLAGLRAEIFSEIKARTQETDLSVPYRKGSYWRYTRTVEGQQYALYCRRAVRDGEATPPIPADGQPLDGEEVLLDGNVLAEGKGFFSLGAYSVSPDDKLLAYSTDFSGDERFTLRIKNLVTGQDLPDEVPGTYYGTAWSLDGTSLFYVTTDDAWRPYRVWRHAIGTPASDDVIVFEESDEKFRVGVGLSRSERYIFVHIGSTLTTEWHVLDAANPTGDLTVIAPRRQGVEYDVEDAPDRLLVLHNADGAEDFELATAPLPGAGDTTRWTPLIPHSLGTRLLGADAFEDYTVLYFRRDGMTGLRVLPAVAGAGGAGQDSAGQDSAGQDSAGQDSAGRSSAGRDITFPEPIYTVSPGANPEFSTSTFRLSYTSMVTPGSVYDCDLATGELTLLKQQAVLPSPSGVPFSAGDYEQYREWATADDGTKVPISVVCRKGTPRDGSAPCVLYGYGSYEISMDPSFSIPRLSLLDRGFVFAIAHIRGGGEMGRSWYNHGKTLAKRNTFTDFVACAARLDAAGWTSASRLVARGGSAGGLLMGAVANLAPDQFAGIVAQVPFVDALNTILDPSLPLTVGEWEEWGDPLHDADVYAYMKSYTPYENVAPVAYPAIFALTSLNDTRVYYHEPAKWMARLRATAHGGPFLLKTEMEAGHGGRSGRYDAWDEEALVLAWIVATATGSAEAKAGA
jgi:oligopeptidase B